MNHLATAVMLVVALILLSIAVTAARDLYLASLSPRRLALWAIPITVLGVLVGMLSGTEEGEFLFLAATASWGLAYLVGVILMIPSNTRPIGRVVLAGAAVIVIAFLAGGLLSDPLAG